VLTSSAALLNRQNIFTVSQIVSGNINATGTISGAFVVGDGSGLTNLPGGGGGVSPAQVSGAITSSLVSYPTTVSVSSSITSAITNLSTRAEVSGVLTSSLSSYALISSVSSSVTAAITNFPTRNETSGAITASLTNYATSTNVSSSVTAAISSFSTRAEVSGVLSSSAALLTRQNTFTTSQIVSGNINATGTISASFIVGDGSGLTNVAGAGGASPAQVSGAITSALVPYSTSVNVSSSITSAISNFPTRAETSGSITGAISNLATRAEVSGVLTSSLSQYALISSVSSSVTSAIANFPIRTEVSSAITASLTGVSGSFSTPAQVSSSVTSAVTNFPTRSEISGVLTASVARLNVTNVFTTSQIISGNLNVTGNISASTITASFFSGDGSGLTGLSSGVPANQISGAITASHVNTPVRSEVSGAITASLTGYVTLTGVSASFATPAQVSSSVTSAITNFPVRAEVSGAITSSLTTYSTSTNVSSSITSAIGGFRTEVSSAITTSLAGYATSANVSSSVTAAITNFPIRTEVSGAITASLTGYATSVNVSSSVTAAITNFPIRTEVSSAITAANASQPTRAEVTGAISNFPVRTEVSGAITASLATYATSTNVSSSVTSAITNFSTRAEVSGVLSSSAALLNRQNIFTTSQTISGNVNITGTVSGAFIIGDGSGLTNIAGAGGASPAQVSGAITSALVPYPTSAAVSSSITSAVANFPTRVETSGAITASLVNYATLVGVSSSFTTPAQVSSSVTSALTNYSTKTEVSGVLTASLSNYANRNQVNTFLATQIISGNLNVTGTISGAFIVGDGSGLTNLPGGPGGVSGAEVSGAITASLTNYATLTGVSSSITSATSNFPARSEISGVLTSSVARLAATNTFTNTQIISGNLNVSGTISGTIYRGNGGELTNILNNVYQVTASAIKFTRFAADHVEGPPPSSVPNTYTISTFVYVDAPVTGSDVVPIQVSNVSGAYHRFLLDGTTNGLDVRLVSNLGGVAVTTIESRRWYFMAFAVSPSHNMTAYVAAINSGSMVTASVAGLSAWTPDRIQIGGSSLFGSTINGRLSQVRLWNRVLTTSELDAERASYTTPASFASIIGCWPLETSASILTALTGASLTVPVSGTTAWTNLSGLQSGFAVLNRENSFIRTQAISGNLNVTGTVSGAFIVGDGSGLTNLPGGPGGVSVGEVSGAITGALTTYALSSDVSASFVDNTELTSALASYATLTGVSSSFATPSQVSGALAPYALASNISSSFVDNTELTSALASYARLDQQNSFTTTQVVSGNLNVTGTVSASAFVGDGSGLTGMTGAALIHKAGRVVASSFAGNPKKATVTFSTPFADADYAASITSVTSGSSYSPIIETQLSGSFVVNMGTNTITSLIQINWVAIKSGESS
jgi:hypothetical protein